MNQRVKVVEKGNPYVFTYLCCPRCYEWMIEVWRLTRRDIVITAIECYAPCNTCLARKFQEGRLGI